MFSKIHRCIRGGSPCMGKDAEKILGFQESLILKNPLLQLFVEMQPNCDNSSISCLSWTISNLSMDHRSSQESICLDHFQIQLSEFGIVLVIKS